MTTIAQPAAKKKINYRSRGKLIIHIILIIGSFVMIFPFVWMILTSFKSNGESLLIPPTFLPKEWLVENFPFKRFFFFLVLTQMMLPNQIFIIPQYQMLASMNQLNSIFALLFPGLVSAFGTFFLRQFYMSLPNVLSEAAVLDGCNTFQIFFKIMLPLTKTAMMALAVFTAVFAYSDMMWPLIVNNNINMMTLSAGISSMQGQYTTRYPILMAGSTLAMIPMLVLYLIFQRQFIEGIALTGTKG